MQIESEDIKQKKMGEDEQVMSLHGDVILGADNISNIAQDWDDLFKRVPEAPAFLSRSWVDTFVSEGRIRGIPLLIVVWAGPELVALLALSVRSLCGIRVAEPIGTMVPSYLGLLADSNYAGAIQTVADVWMKKRVAHAFFNKYLSSLDEVTNSFMTELACRGFTYKFGFQRPCRWIKLGCSFDDYLKNNKSGKSRQTIRRKDRMLCKNNEVEHEYYTGIEVTQEIINRIAAIQQESWMKRRDAAVLNQPFHQRLLLNMAKEGFGHVWLLRIDKEDAAFVYAYIAHGNLNYAWTAFKLKYRTSGSVGMVLTSRTIRKVCEEGILSYDFGFGDSQYKQFWATDNHDVAMAVAGRGALGYLIVLCHSVMWRLARMEWLLRIYIKLRAKLRNKKF
jgi:CelD/BcsL family acetyltransferase involved in cellulose biosynthesis